MTISDYMRLCGRGPEERFELWTFCGVGPIKEYRGPGHDLLTNWTREGDDAVLCAGMEWLRSQGFKQRAKVMIQLSCVANMNSISIGAYRWLCEECNRPGHALFNAIVEVKA